LVIVGRQGWMVEDLQCLISNSREHEARLFWVQGASDEYLESLYRSSSALIAASEGEGFGLPLIEAAARSLPLIARDIPVFREVAGEGAYFFNASSAEEMAKAIDDWLDLDSKGLAPTSDCISTIRWDESASEFFGKLLSDRAYGTIAD
jgi:glycosyltransferase involved in cell wall biosynthesis